MLSCVCCVFVCRKATIDFFCRVCLCPQRSYEDRGTHTTPAIAIEMNSTKSEYPRMNGMVGWPIQNVKITKRCTIQYSSPSICRMNRFTIRKQAWSKLLLPNTNTSQLRAVCLLPSIVSPFVPCSVIRCESTITNSSASAIASSSTKGTSTSLFSPLFFLLLPPPFSSRLPAHTTSHRYSHTSSQTPTFCNCQPTTIPEDHSSISPLSSPSVQISDLKQHLFLFFHNDCLDSRITFILDYCRSTTTTALRDPAQPQAARPPIASTPTSTAAHATAATDLSPTAPPVSADEQH